jgi:hypothetical protein
MFLGIGGSGRISGAGRGAAQGRLELAYGVAGGSADLGQTLRPEEYESKHYQKSYFTHAKIHENPPVQF